MDVFVANVRHNFYALLYQSNFSFIRTQMYKNINIRWHSSISYRYMYNQKIFCSIVWNKIWCCGTLQRFRVSAFLKKMVRFWYNLKNVFAQIQNSVPQIDLLHGSLLPFAAYCQTRVSDKNVRVIFLFGNSLAYVGIVALYWFVPLSQLRYTNDIDIPIE